MTIAEWHKQWQEQVFHGLPERGCMLCLFSSSDKENRSSLRFIVEVCASFLMKHSFLTSPFLVVHLEIWKMRTYPGATFRFSEQMLQVANTGLDKESAMTLQSLS